MKVSIIIPVKNGLEWLKQSIPIFFQQNKIDQIELVLIDSGSTDGIFDYIRAESNNNIVFVENCVIDFNHGRFRNFGVQLSSHEFVVFTVQDAIPINNDWLINLLTPMIDLHLDAICGKQIVVKDFFKNTIDWYRPIDEPSLYILSVSPNDFLMLDPKYRKKLTAWDNVNAAYRKSSLLKLPFKEVAFGEDAYWANDAILNGLRIGYTPFSIVNHYHHYSSMQFFDRYLAEFYLNKTLYGLSPEINELNFKKILSWCRLILTSRFNLGYFHYWLKYNVISYKMQRRATVFMNDEPLSVV